MTFQLHRAEPAPIPVLLIDSFKNPWCSRTGFRIIKCANVQMQLNILGSQLAKVIRLFEGFDREC